MPACPSGNSLVSPYREVDVSMYPGRERMPFIGIRLAIRSQTLSEKNQRSTGVIIQSRLSRSGICGEEGFEEIPWQDTLSSGGLHQTGKNAVGYQTATRAGSEAYFAEDHQMAKSLFGKIVRGRHTGSPEEGK
jgi:hypothetical protein